MASTGVLQDDEEVFFGPVTAKERVKFSRRKTTLFLPYSDQSNKEIKTCLGYISSEGEKATQTSSELSLDDAAPDLTRNEVSSENECQIAKKLHAFGMKRYDGIEECPPERYDAPVWKAVCDDVPTDTTCTAIDYQDKFDLACDGKNSGGSGLTTGVCQINTASCCVHTDDGGSERAWGVTHPHVCNMIEDGMQASIDKPLFTQPGDAHNKPTSTQSNIEAAPNVGLGICLTPSVNLNRGIHKTTAASDGLVKQLDFASNPVLSNDQTSSLKEDGLLGCTEDGTLDQSLFTDEESLIDSSLRGEITGALHALSSETAVLGGTTSKLSGGSSDLNETASSVSSGPVPENITDSHGPQAPGNVEVPKPVFDLMPLASALNMPSLKVTTVELHDEENSAFKTYAGQLCMDKITGIQQGHDMTQVIRSTEVIGTTEVNDSTMDIENCEDITAGCLAEPKQVDLDPQPELRLPYALLTVDSDEGSNDSGIADNVCDPSSELVCNTTTTAEQSADSAKHPCVSKVVFKDTLSPLVSVKVKVPSPQSPRKSELTQPSYCHHDSTPLKHQVAPIKPNTPCESTQNAKRRIKTPVLPSKSPRRMFQHALSSSSSSSSSAAAAAAAAAAAENSASGAVDVPVSKENCCPRHKPMKNSDGRPLWNPSTLISPKSMRGSYLSSKISGSDTPGGKQGTPRTPGSAVSQRSCAVRRTPRTLASTAVTRTASSDKLRQTLNEQPKSIDISPVAMCVEDTEAGDADMAKLSGETVQEKQFERLAQLRKSKHNPSEISSASPAASRVGKKRACSPSVLASSAPCKKVPFAPSSAQNLPIMSQCFVLNSPLSQHQPASSNTLSLNERQLDAVTHLNTMCNSQQLARVTKKPRVQSILKPSPGPRESTKIQWCNDTVLSSCTDAKCPSTPESRAVKPILSIKPPEDLYPYSDQPPSPVVIRKSPTRNRENPLSRPLWQ